MPYSRPISRIRHQVFSSCGLPIDRVRPSHRNGALRRVLALLLVVWAASPALAAEDQPSGEALEPSPAAAAELLAAERWSDAEKMLRALLAEDSSQPGLWMSLGIAELRQGDAEAALAAYRRAEEAGAGNLQVAYRSAAAHAARGDLDAAFAALSSALDAGFPLPDRLRADADLATLRDDPRFAEMVQRAEVNARPCAFDETYDQFDFWIGSWDVYAPGGQLAGRNLIERVESGCALSERWKSATGGTGRSLNFYDPGLGAWRQIWIDGRGGVIDVSGSLVDGAMRFTGEHRYPDGRRAPYRMTFTPNEDGTVRQLIEESADGGETFFVGFDGLYRPVDEPPAVPAPEPKADGEDAS